MTENNTAELRVLQVFAGLGVGGAETWLLALLKYFHEAPSELPFRVTTEILLTNGTPAVFDEEARSLGATLHYNRFGRDRLPQFASEFRRILRTGSYDVLHDHQDYTSGVHFLLGAGLLPPVRIAHVHNPFYQIREHTADRTSRMMKSVGKVLVSALASSVAGTSVQALEEYGYRPELTSGRAEAVYCGFDVKPFAGSRDANRRSLLQELGWPADSKVILFVGRLGGTELVRGGKSHKNPAFALDVARHCVKEDPRVRIAFAGSGDAMQPILEGRVREMHLEAHVRFLGLRPDVPHLMLGSDLLLFPSSAEGLGMAAVEAQAAGLPVLASDSTPRECVVVPELVEFLSLDKPAADWALAALSLMTEKKLSALDANKSVAASSFSIENSARRLVSLYIRNDPRFSLRG